MKTECGMQNVEIGSVLFLHSTFCILHSPFEKTMKFAPILLLAFLVACGGEKTETTQPAAGSQASASKSSLPPPTPTEAKDIIANSAEWSDFMFTSGTWTIPTSTAGMHEKTKAMTDQLVDAGWIRYEQSEVILTDKGFNDKRFVMRPNNVIDIMPLATKSILDVTKIEPGDEPKVHFTWRWKPNEIGASLESGMFADRFAKTFKATATLYRVKDKWSVFSVRSADPPAV